MAFLVLGPGFAGCLAETNLTLGFAAITDAAGLASNTLPIPGGGLWSGVHI